MTHLTSKKTADILATKSQDLQFIITKANHLLALDAAVKKYLDSKIAKACQVANLTSGSLVLIAVNSSVATELKLLSAGLIREFKNHPTLSSIKAISCKVRPATEVEKAKPAAPMAPLSEKTAKFVRDVSDTIQDPALKEIMQRIANHTFKPRA